MQFAQDNFKVVQWLHMALAEFTASIYAEEGMHNAVDGKLCLLCN
jgi:hypothetical protein